MNYIICLFLFLSVFNVGISNGFPSMNKNKNFGRTIQSLDPLIRHSKRDLSINSTAHPYVAPGPNDKRGPCPALNTLANHGYLDHGGISTTNLITQVQMEVTSFCADLANFITAVQFGNTGNLGDGISSDGSPGTISIGAPASLTALPLIKGGGADSCQNVQHDASISRKDCDTGDSYTFDFPTWNASVNYVNSNCKAPWSTPCMCDLFHFRYNQSVTRNPNIVMTPNVYIDSFATYFAVAGAFHLPNQDPTFDTVSSFFLHETLPEGYGLFSTCSSLTYMLENAFDCYQAHPIAFTPLQSCWPAKKECMLCFLRSLFLQTLPTPINALLTSFVQEYTFCNVTDCVCTNGSSFA